MPPPFSQGWVGNIRTLAKAHWWDGTSVYRVVDNWVAQWGNGEDDPKKAKPLPAGLKVVPESEYVTPVTCKVYLFQGKVINEACDPEFTELDGGDPYVLKGQTGFLRAGRLASSCNPVATGMARPLLWLGRRCARPVAGHRQRRRALRGDRPRPAPARPQHRGRSGG